MEQVRSAIVMLLLLSGAIALEDFAGCHRSKTNLEDIKSTENEKCLVVNLRIPKYTELFKLTVTYNDESDDVLFLASLKATTTFKFYNFSTVSISQNNNISFCLNYQLLSYTVPEEPLTELSRANFSPTNEHLTRHIYQKEGSFKKNNTELTLCKEFNQYKRDWGKSFEDCDERNPSQTTQLIRHADCPAFWTDSALCHQFSFRVLVSERVIPKDILMDDHMKNTLSNTRRYLDQEELEIFWSSLIKNKAFNEYERPPSSTISNVLMVVSAIIGILVLVFIIVVAIFRSPIFSESFNSDEVEIIDKEEKREDVDFTIEMTSPEQVIPDFYTQPPSSAFIISESAHFDSITEEEANNDTELKEMYSTVGNKRHGFKRKISRA